MDAKIKMSYITSVTCSTITYLREIFSSRPNGLRDLLVSHNAIIFTSTESKAFCERNGIRQRFIAHGHPSPSRTLCSDIKKRWK